MKKVVINKTSLPAISLLNNDKYNYIDAYCAPMNDAENKITVEDVARCFFSSSPKWVSGLFALRNRIVRLIGLKVPEQKPDITNAAFLPGERFGLFKVFAGNEHEIIVGEDDKHLNFKVSMCITSGHSPAKLITLSTVVTIHNRFGRIYFWLIKPFHKQVVRAILKRVAKQLAKG